jgi:outer membrane lipoprotein
MRLKVRADAAAGSGAVMNAPQLYVGQEARFGGKVVDIQNQQGKSRLEIATVPLDSGARPVLGEASRAYIC